MAFLGRQWFLILLFGGIALAVLAPETIAPLTHIPARGVVVGSLFLSSFGMSSRQLATVLVRPAAPLLALFVSYVLVPLLTIPLCQTLAALDYQIGLVVIASVPCTLASAAIWTRMAGGNDAAALLGIVLTVATSWLATTAWITALTGTRVELDPFAMMADLALYLILPVLTGQMLRAWPVVREFAQRRIQLLSVLSRLLVLSMILQSVARVVTSPRASSWWSEGGTMLASLASCLAVHLGGLTAGWQLGRLLGLSRGDAIAVAFAGSQKTLPVAILIVARFFPGHPLAVLPILFYHVGQLIVDTFIADVFARGNVPHQRAKEA